MRPFDPALLRTTPAVRRPLVLLAAVGVAQGAATIATAFALTGVVVAIARSRPIGTPLAWLVGLFIARGVLAALTELAAAYAGARVSTGIRTALLRTWEQRTVDECPAPARALTLATSGSAAVEPYVARYLPALVAAAVVPVAAIGVLALVDWRCALVVVLTLPLLPLFAALIGRETQDQTQRRWRSLADLAGHFLDVVRGLPTLVAYGRAEKQVAVIADVSDRHRRATMRTLRTAFLSSSALELLATISVAIVAVLCGVRLAWGSMDLGTAMVAILLAPEAYWPVRRVGQEFHNAADGAEALAAIAAELAQPAGDPRPGARQPHHDGRIIVTSLSYSYPGADRPVLHDFSMTAGPGLTVITGPSGVGKSTLLELCAGLRRPGAGTVLTPRAHLVTQRPFLPNGTIGHALALGTGAVAEAQWEALRTVGLDGVVAGLPDGLQTVIGDDGFGLSAGQRARLGLARALLAPETVILLDEPTAHLDDDAADLAHEAIRTLAERRCVLAVTHRPDLVARANAHVHLIRSEHAPAQVDPR